jgi:hypothetical protein
VLDGPINGVWFQAYLEQVLVPTLGAKADDEGKVKPVLEFSW